MSLRLLGFSPLTEQLSPTPRFENQDAARCGTPQLHPTKRRQLFSFSRDAPCGSSASGTSMRRVPSQSASAPCSQLLEPEALRIGEERWGCPGARGVLIFEAGHSAREATRPAKIPASGRTPPPLPSGPRKAGLTPAERPSGAPASAGPAVWEGPGPRGGWGGRWRRARSARGRRACSCGSSSRHRWGALAYAASAGA